jgi:ABC-type multidrug transport system ATPase subunit
MSTECVVILSTHIVEDIANTCHDMAVLHQGEVRFRGSPAALIQETAGQVWELDLPAGQTPHPDWRIVSQAPYGGGLRLRLVGPRPADAIHPVRPTLEEAYLVLMGQRDWEG